MNDFLLYIDPGSGSLLFQLLISGIVGFLAFAKLNLQKFKSFFKRGGKGEDR